MIADVYDIFQNVAQANGLEFYYGVKDYQNVQSNLIDLSGKTVMYLAPIVKRKTPWSTSKNASETYEILVFIGVLSKMNEEYKDKKYIDRIRPLETMADKICSQANCDNNYSINTCELKEAINEFDGNLDGYNITIQMQNVDSL